MAHQQVPASDHDWLMVWEEQFTGSALDFSKWSYHFGKGPNHELQNYTSAEKNVRFEPDPAQLGNQFLVVQAHEETTEHDSETFAYTSGRINTRGKFNVTYGKIEMRAKLPFGQGIWPAFCMLGEDIRTIGWPACGEIDIMEYIGKTPTNVYGTLHGPGYSGGKGIGTKLDTPDTLSAEFHTYGVEWEPDCIRWYFDGALFQTRSPADLGGDKWVFDHPFFILINLAIGGDWPGNPDATTRFPQTYTVDYVKVYQRN